MFEASTAPRPTSPARRRQPLRAPAGGHADAGAHRPGRVAERIKNAWLKAPRGRRAHGDIYRAGNSATRVGTQGFTDAVIERLGEEPAASSPCTTSHGTPIRADPARASKRRRSSASTCSSTGTSPDAIRASSARSSSAVSGTARAQMITNRGVKVFPDGLSRDLLHRPLALPLRGIYRFVEDSRRQWGVEDAALSPRDFFNGLLTLLCQVAAGRLGATAAGFGLGTRLGTRSPLRGLRTSRIGSGVSRREDEDNGLLRAATAGRAACGEEPRNLRVRTSTIGS
jgi:hypothetical protein